MLKLRLQYFGHLIQGVDSLEKTLMPGGIEGRRRRGQQRMSWLEKGKKEIVLGAHFFPVVMYGYESWAIKKAKH